jgi:nucleotide-binding universal stress UspA family protein
VRSLNAVTPIQVKRILVPLSMCPHSEQAFRMAHDLAEHYDSEICAIHVFADPKEKDPLYSQELREPEMYDKVFRQRVDDILEKVCPTFKCSKKTRTIVTHGSFADEILREAADIRAHLIVMGTHSEKTLQQSIRGSTMTRVLKTAPCPVLTIRYPVGEEDAKSED